MLQAMMDHIEEKRHELHLQHIKENVVQYLLGSDSPSSNAAIKIRDTPIF